VKEGREDRCLRVIAGVSAKSRMGWQSDQFSVDQPIGGARNNALRSRAALNEPDPSWCCDEPTAT